MKDYLNFTFNENNPDLVSVTDEAPLWSAPFGLKLLEMVALKKNINVLDIGCGAGFPLVELSRRLGDSSHLYGIDPWEAALDRVRLKMRVYDIKNITLLHGVAEELPFDGGYFDLIVSNNGVNNVQDMKLVFQEIGRTSKPGAQFVFTMNTEDTMFEFYDALKAVLDEAGRQSETEKIKEHIYTKRRPIDEIKQLVKSSGFYIEHILYDDFRLSFVDSETMFRHPLIKYWFLDGWKSIMDVKDRHDIFSKVEVKMDENANGCIHLAVPFVTFNCRYVKEN